MALDFSRMINFGFDGILILMAIILFLGLIAGGIIFYYMRKRWFIKVFLYLPRGFKEEKDGSVSGVFSYEGAKAMFDTRRGIVYIKRKRKRKQPMKPFNIKKYLSPNNWLKVVQVSTGELMPISDESYIHLETDEPVVNKKGEVVKDENGQIVFEEFAWMNAKADSSEHKSWGENIEEMMMNTYTVGSFFTKHAPMIVMGILVFINILAFIYLASKV